MDIQIPDFIVHYSRGEPFRSITSLPAAVRDEVIGELNETNAWGLARFSDQRYLEQRADVESKIRKRFIELGGNPSLIAPIYFYLGRHPRFEEHERNVGHVIYLRDLDPRSISFTYGDSMLSFVDENRRRAGEKYLNPLCDEVYSFEELPRLFTHRSFQTKDALHVEAQLWIAPERGKVKPLVR